MDIHELGKVLSNRTRVNLLQLLSKRDYSAAEAHKGYTEEFKDDKHRESIYRELEKMADKGILEKTYDDESKQLKYSLAFKIVKVNFEKGELETIE